MNNPFLVLIVTSLIAGLLIPTSAIFLAKFGLVEGFSLKFGNKILYVNALPMLVKNRPSLGKGSLRRE